MNPKSIFKRLLLYPINKIDSKVKQTNWYKNNIPNIDNYPGDSWYRVHLERNYDIVNLGSSSAVFCFNYEGFCIKAFNWALKPQSMEYSFNVLKQYFSILRQKGIVLIPFCPFSGLCVTGKWTETANDKYFHILDGTLIENYDAVARRRVYPFRSNPKQAIKRLLRDVPPADMYSYNIQCKSSHDFLVSAKKWIDLWKKEFNISDLNQPLSKENQEGKKNRLKTVNEIINFCKKRDLQPVIVLPPAHRSLLVYLTPEFKSNYITSFINDLNHNDVLCLDYLSDERFTSDEFFRDSYFMNESGAKAFTKQILMDLKLII